MIKEESLNELNLVKTQLNGILERVNNQDLIIQQQGTKIQEQGTKIQEQDSRITAQDQLIQSQAKEIALLKSQANPDLEESVNERFEELEDEVESLENKEKALTAPTCAHWAMYGVTQNGEYLVDPDGELFGEPPFLAHCDFTTNSTEILHDSEDEITIPNCNQIGCHEHPINYKASETQIQKLISLSQGCVQSITFNCFSAPLKQNDVHHGWWTDRLGNKQVCHDCNQCDSKRPEWMEDVLVSEDLDLLPMKSFVYGPLEFDMEKANFSIGRLSCHGLKDSSDLFSLREIVKKMEEDINSANIRIDGNKQDVGKNRQYIQDAEEGILRNGEKIHWNSEAIQTNLRGIEHNRDDVQKSMKRNSDDILRNSGDIRSIIGSIQTNRRRIQANDEEIQKLINELEDLDERFEVCVDF